MLLVEGSSYHRWRFLVSSQLGFRISSDARRGRQGGGGSFLLRPLGVVSRPVLVRRQVDPNVPPEEGDDTLVGEPGHTGLKVVHDAQGLGGFLVVIAGEVGDPHLPLTAHVASLEILHADHWSGIHVANITEIKKKMSSKIITELWGSSPFIIIVLLEVGEIQGLERYELLIENDVLEMFLEPLTVRHSDLAKSLCSGYLRSDAGPAPPLLWQSHPVVPVTLGPLLSQFVLPELSGHHPAQAGEEVRPVEQLGGALVDEPGLAVVIPGTDTPEAWVGPQQRQGRREVLVEVWGDLQVILHYDDLLEVHLHEYLVESPAVVPGNLEISNELFLFLRDLRGGLVRLSDVDQLVTIALYDGPGKTIINVTSVATLQSPVNRWQSY